MNEPFLGGIYMVAFNFAPTGFALCNGQLLPIAQNSALFNLLGTTYGGDGQTNFALPNLQGRVPIHQGSNGTGSFIIGQVGGEETHTLLTGEMPAHTHTLGAVNGAGTASLPAGAYLAQGPSTGSGPNATALNTYTANTTPLVTLNPASIQTVGSSQPHNNIQPYVCVSFIIALTGIFPSQG